MKYPVTIEYRGIRAEIVPTPSNATIIKIPPPDPEALWWSQTIHTSQYAVAIDAAMWKIDDMLDGTE